MDVKVEKYFERFVEVFFVLGLDFYGEVGVED